MKRISFLAALLTPFRLLAQSRMNTNQILPGNAVELLAYVPMDNRWEPVTLDASLSLNQTTKVLSAIGGAAINENTQIFAAATGQTQFQITQPTYVLPSLEVYRNGFWQEPGTAADYQVSGTTVIFNGPLAATDRVALKYRY